MKGVPVLGRERLAYRSFLLTRIRPMSLCSEPESKET